MMPLTLEQGFLRHAVVSVCERLAAPHGAALLPLTNEERRVLQALSDLRSGREVDKAMRDAIRAAMGGFYENQ